MRKRPLLLIACVFLAGVSYQRFSLGVFILAPLFLVLWEWRFARKTKKYFKAAGRSLILLSAFILGIFHMQKEEVFRAAYMSKIEDGSRIAVWGELIKMETTEYGYRGILSNCYLRQDKEYIPCNDVMVYMSNDQYKVGQIHKITGKVNMFSRARNQGNFDSYSYYQSLKIDFAMEGEEFLLLEEEENPVKRYLVALKEQICRVYDSCMSQKAAGFYKTMVMGDKTDLDENLKQLFQLGGISHILAISGLHVSILGRGLYRILRRGGMGFWLAGIFGGLLLLGYYIMVGNSVSTQRAVGMMFLFFLAQGLGRSYDMLNALGGMILVLLWQNPFLIENSGFWFSVMALLGVGVVGKALAKGHLLGLKMSLGISLATIPITAISYFEIPLYSPFINAVILPLLTPIFCLAVVVGLLGSFLPYAVTCLLLQPCQWLMNFYEWVCEIISKLPGASIICGKPMWWQIILYYVVLFGGIYIVEKIWDNKALYVGIIIFCFLCIVYPKEKAFEISFLDVGQGDGIYISGGDETTYFIDGGSSNVKEVGLNRILPFLKAKGIQKIDYWFVSHCDTDHISGLQEILDVGYEIGHIVVYERCSNGEKYHNLIEKASDAGVEVLHMKGGDRICSQQLEVLCVALEKENKGELQADANNNSLILQVERRESEDSETFTALFAGDISIEVENCLGENGLLKDVDLVKANHHGSNYSNGTKFFEITRPAYIVVSCSEYNVYGHPGAMAVKRMKDSGARIFYTMDGGQISFPLIQ